MGFALAEVFAARGAEVVLIAGPVAIPTPPGNIKRINVVSAEQMFSVCKMEFPFSDLAIMAAAVADYRPASFSKNKIKRENSSLSIELEANRDIAAALGELKTSKQYLVGFALETDNEINNATKKMKTKNLDLIVLNSLRDVGAGFGFDTNKITIIDRNNIMRKFDLKSKVAVAEDIANVITEYI